jgi:Mrp family chromosome partitioning ATPase
MSESRRGLPLPLVTQQMMAQLPPHTVIDDHTKLTAAAPPATGPAAQIAAMAASAGMTAGSTLSMATFAQPGARSVPIDQTPTEISLTQHHLPNEELDARLVMVQEPDSDRAAAFRVLRHHLMAAGNPQVVAVASPRRGEGKTTTAVNLAISLAECGRAKVLLVETHLRRPQLAEIFRFNPPWCFAEQLASHRHQPLLPWTLVEIPQLWLHVAAVNPHSDRTQILDAPAFAIAMERLRLGGYDHIVIDTPPVLGSADVNLIQDAVDGIALSLTAKRSTARDLRRTLDQLGDNKIVGTVFLE